MRGLRKRVVTVNFGSPREAAEFLEHVSKLVPDLAAEVKGGTVKLVVMAPPEELEREYAKVREMLRQWRMSRQVPRKGLYRHHVAMVLSSAKLRVGIPVAALVELLRLKGRKAELRGSYIVTDARFEEVVEEATLFSEKYADALKLVAAPMLKRLAAVLAAAGSLTVDEALRILGDLGLIKRDERHDRLVLAAEYGQALERVKAFVAGRSSRRRERGAGGGSGEERAQ